MRADGTLDALEPGTVQRGRLRERASDIAWTAACLVLGLGALLGAIGVATGATEQWGYVAVAATLFTVVVVLRVAALRDRARRRL
ncbi:hypothetical protein [Streptomyces sp. NPDC015131]|uniref:hypothetical protein n=1 Tax=Streptomyces sp. NPDC015131 TaxID=3364941 RepID=UPI0036FE8B17